MIFLNRFWGKLWLIAGIFFLILFTFSHVNAQTFIEGRVLSPDNQPVANVDVSAFTETCHQGHVNGARTDSNGSYSIEVPEGTYYLFANSSPETVGTYVPEWFTASGGVMDCAAAEGVNSASTGIDFVLETGTFITGKVTDTAGNPLQSICVNANIDQACGGIWVGGTQTDANGDYQLIVPQGGQVFVGVDPNCADLSFLWEMYDGADGTQDCNAAQTVNAGAAGINFVLEAGDTITGKVTDSAGNPQQGVCVGAQIDTACGGPGVGGTQTDTNGDYQLIVAQGSQVFIGVDPNCADLNFLSEMYDGGDGTQDCSAAQAVNSGASGINFVLEAGDTITGKVTDADGNPLQSVCVDAQSDTACGGPFIAGAQTDANGDYQLIVPKGSQVFPSVNPECAGLTYVGEIYDGADGAQDCNAAQAVNAGASGIDFILEAGDTISGKVTDANGSPLQGVCVGAQNDTACGGPGVGGTQTDPNGDYQLIVPQGSQVFIGVDPNCASLNFLSEMYDGGDGTQDCNAAQAVNAGAAGINFVLEAGDTINGKVTDAGGNPLLNVCVNAQLDTACGGTHVAGAQTDANGDYQLIVPQGSQVFVSVDPNCADLSFLWEMYDGADGTQDCNAAQAISAGASGINFLLEAGAIISGKIKDASGNGISNVCVNALGDDWQWLGGSSSDENGSYRITIQPGEYRICTDVLCGGNNPPSDFADSCWDNSQSLSVCQAGQSLTGIDIILPVNGAITGTVRSENGDPLPDVYVTAFGSQCWNNWAGESKTDQNGQYEISVPPGDYYLNTEISRENPRFFTDQWWTFSGGTTDCNTAEGITVTANNSSTADFILDGGFSMEGVVKLAHLADGSIKTYIDIYLDRFPGQLPDDIDAITVTGPDGSALYTKPDLPFEPPAEFFLAVDGQPDIGNYTFSVTSGSYTETYVNSQSENKVLPLVDTNTFVPAAGSTHQSLTFSWDPIDAGGIPLFYRFRIKDMGGNTVYQTGRTEGMTRHTVPEGILEPGKTYQWRIRACDAAIWTDVQTASYTDYVTFTLDRARGDFNQDFELDLEDAINGLKILTGMPICGSGYAAYTQAFGQITLADIILVLQHIAGVR